MLHFARFDVCSGSFVEDSGLWSCFLTLQWIFVPLLSRVEVSSEPMKVKVLFLKNVSVFTEFSSAFAFQRCGFCHVAQIFVVSHHAFLQTLEAEP
jgi:hypothetical protein